MSRKPESIAFSQVQFILILILLTVHGVFRFIGMQSVLIRMMTPSLKTVIEGMKSTEKRPSFLLSDAGNDSHDSNKIVLEYGVIPVIAARSNSVGDIIKTNEGDRFRGEYMPREYHKILGRIYDLRTIVERKNSNEVVGYNREMPTHGINWARCFFSISNITALTA